MKHFCRGFRASGRGTTAALVAALGAVGCGQPEPPPPTPPEVTVATPLRRDVTFYADFTGRTASVQRAEIRARVTGFLERMNFVPGDMVKKGQLLFLIEPEPYQAQRDQAEASLRSAEANRARAQSDLERLEEAIKTNAVSQQDVTRGRAELAQAEASVLSSSAELAQAKIQLQYTEVRSPVAGKVDRNAVDLGNLVGQTEATLLTTVVQMNPLWVYFDLPETIVLQMLADLRRVGIETPRDIAAPEAQDLVKFFVATQVDEGFPHEGHLDFMSNTVNAATGTIEVRGVMPNDDLLLLPGVFVRVRVPGRLMPDSILVSERSIGTDLGGKYVMVVGDENVVEQRYIELGPREDDGYMVVTSGLEGKESYIVNGLLRARPGFPVSPEPHRDDDGDNRPGSQG
jgi:RND family efflux transporter MFP subunit